LGIIPIRIYYNSQQVEGLFILTLLFGVSYSVIVLKIKIAHRLRQQVASLPLGMSLSPKFCPTFFAGISYSLPAKNFTGYPPDVSLTLM